MTILSNALKYLANSVRFAEHAEFEPEESAALLGEVERLRADALRYRFLRPHLSTDGDVDHPDHATRFFTWLQIEEEHIPLPDAIGWSNVDEAIDNAIAQQLPAEGQP